MHKIIAIARKEFAHIMRDARSLMIVIAMPIMMTFLYGYAINLDTEEIVIGVVDYDRSSESRALISKFLNSPYFSPSPADVDPADPEAILRRGEASAVLQIRPGFSKAIVGKLPYQLSLLIDGADATVAAAVQSYANGVLNSYLLDKQSGAPQTKLLLSPIILYNPDLESSHYFVPGLVAIILMMISALLTSVTIAREKETGTMEQLLTAPIEAHHILIGKLLPYLVIAFLDGILVLLFAKFLFDVPFVGSQMLLIILGLAYVATALMIGILISAFSNTQQVAMMTAITVTVLPSVMLSGFIFALDNMPVLLQTISKIVPATYFIVIIRDIMLKGSGFTLLIYQSVPLLLLMIFFLFIATKRFKTQVL